MTAAEYQQPDVAVAYSAVYDYASECWASAYWHVVVRGCSKPCGEAYIAGLHNRRIITAGANNTTGVGRCHMSLMSMDVCVTGVQSSQFRSIACVVDIHISKPWHSVFRLALIVWLCCAGQEVLV